MRKYFNDTAILSTLNPEAFLTFEFEAGDASYWIVPVCNNSGIYVNGLTALSIRPDPSIQISSNVFSQSLKLNADVSIASFNIFTFDVSNFDASLNFYSYLETSTGYFMVGTSDNVSVFYRPNIFEDINILENETILLDDEASYLILRTNPKFTGNIKIIIDESINVFLDTFKISDILSNKKYRKQQISTNSILSSDIRKTFASLPLGELYKNDIDNTLNVEVPKTELSKQYEMTYNFGAYTLPDELYSEDNALLAPLWINSKLPDYFCIFRMPGVYNVSSYTSNFDDSKLAFKYMEESDIIKTWSFKNDSPLGTYLQTHLKDIEKYPASTFLSLTDTNLADAESDPNTWYGIAVDKGIVTGRSETPYFFNQSINNLSHLNAFVSNGFERNNLLSNNLLNLEYVFSDNDVSSYTMNRYFGLYLTENIIYEIGYYASDSSFKNFEIVSFDQKDSSSFINSFKIFPGGILSKNYKNRLFVLNDNKNLKRIIRNSQLKSISDVSNYISKPNKNLFTTAISQQNVNPFITLHLNTTLNPGEHLRIINKTTQKIWEIFGVNSSLACDPFVSTYNSVGYPTIYQTSFSTVGSITDQLHSIENAIDRFADYDGTYFRAGIRGNNWVSIILNDDASLVQDWEFQRITSQTVNDPNDPNSTFNTSASPTDIIFFGRFSPTTTDFETLDVSALYGPINFEFYGKRKSISIPFFNRNNNNLYSFSNSNKELDKFVDPLLYQNTIGWYNKIINFDVSNHLFQYVQDPLNDNKYLIQTETHINTYKQNWNAYSLYPLTISLMGINPIKDIDYTVYDATLGFKSEYWYKRDNDISTYSLLIKSNTIKYIEPKSCYIVKYGVGTISINGSIINYDASTIFNTYDTSAFVWATSDTLISYPSLDGSLNLKSYIAGRSEQDVSDYFLSNKLLNYSLTSPTVSHWVGLGTDCRNNQFRLIFNSSTFDSSSASNYIPTVANYTDEISYPVFKYLTPGERNWEDYVYYDINDTIKYLKDGSTYYKTVKQLIFAEPYVDIFSKFILINKDKENVKNRSTICYYNEFKNTIDTLFLGLSLSFSIANNAKNTLDIKNYHKYHFSFISSPSRNRDSKKPLELIINQNTQTILLIWYQGADVLNYTMSGSSTVPGKSVLDASDGYNKNFRSFKDGPDWSFIKTPFIVNNSTVQKGLISVYSNDYGITDSSLIRPYGQFNFGNNINSVWTAYTLNNTITTLASKYYFTTSNSYNTFSQYVSYSYLNNINTYGDNIVNYGYKLLTNENAYKNNKLNLNTLNYFISKIDQYLNCFIINESNIITNNNFGLSPIIINVNDYRAFNNIKTYNGWYKPKFDSIIDFKYNEDKDLINITQRDFILANTNIRECKNIDQLWYNKVVDSVSNTDITNGNAISYYSSFNVFKSLWDASYYVYRDNLNTVMKSGYESDKELPSFFGSKLIKLPNNLSLENWNSTTLMYTTSVDTTSVDNYVLSLNVTRAITILFNSNLTFINNWSGLLNAGAYIDSYIKNSVLPYYDINVSKIYIDIYNKTFNTDVFAYNYNSSFTIDDKQNFKSEVVVENNEYIYKLTIPKENNFTYFVRLNLIKK